ncbi:hypothetical protein OH77DRAFT_1379121, partial [Trametes cingulata]
VRADMNKTILPSFLGRAPTDVGSAGAGTLSADQWRTFCTINLTISLVRLWSISSTTDRHRALLDNFVDLVVAVKHAIARRTSPDRITRYEISITRYVRGLRALFPDLDLVPNHHFALHLPDFLRRFGPPYSYWAFPFERYIRLLRNVNIN